MKKIKILTVFGILLAMGITACNNQNSGEQPGDKSGEPAQSQQSGQSQGGEEGHKTHTWDAGEVTTQPGCETEGVKTFKCTYEGCNETKTETIPALGHQWGQAIPVTGADGGVDYNKFECERNNKADKAVKYEVALNKAVDKDGKAVSEVSGAAGFVKLGSNGNSIYLKFNSDAYGKGKLYLRGSMDYWYDDNNHNENRTLFSGKDGNSANDNKENPNLEVKVNGVALTVTNKKPMSELLPQVDADHPAVKSGNSPAGEVLYGDDLVVGKGLNEIVYTRKDSYNLAVSHLLFVFVPEAHENHTMTEWADEKAATCTEDGVQSRHCSVCGIVETQVVKAGHKWGEPTVIAANTEKGTSLVKKYVCSGCQKVKYEVPMYVKDASEQLVKNFTLDGEEKTFQPEGSIKLGSGGNKNYSFKIEFEKFVYGMAYQVGSMDQYGLKEDGTPNNNYNQKYTSGGSNGGLNFKFEVGTTEIDASEYKNTALSEWLGTETREIAKNEAGDKEVWSLAKPCPIGQFDAEAGVVTFKYTRLGSYNLANEAFEFIVTETVHTHQAATTWTSDGEAHWHECSSDCPVHKKLDYAKHNLEADESKTDEDSTCAKEGKHYVKCSICEKEITQVIEKKAHTWVADESKTDVPATCAVEGVHYVKCSECGATEGQPIAKSAHAWVEGTAVKNSDAKDVIPLTCSNECGDVGAKMDSADGDTALDSGKLVNATKYTWKFKVAKAGHVEFYMTVKKGSQSTNIAEGYKLTSGDIEGKITFTNERIGSGYSTAKLLKVGEIDVAALDANGEIVISLTTPEAQGYRPSFAGAMYIYVH